MEKVKNEQKEEKDPASSERTCQVDRSKVFNPIDCPETQTMRSEVHLECQNIVSEGTSSEHDFLDLTLPAVTINPATVNAVCTATCASTPNLRIKTPIQVMANATEMMKGHKAMTDNW